MRRAALGWLSRREHSRAELRRKLARKFGDSVPLEPLLDWLESHRFLDDRRFAEIFVRGRIGRGQGALRIRQELQQRGLREEVIEAALTDAGCDWFQLAVDIRARRFRGVPTDQKERARQLRFLQYRGFTGEQCFHALDRQSDDLPEGVTDG